MNFSTVPPRRSSSERTRAWYDDSSARTSSGSDRSARAVDPTRSQNTTVTIFRSSTGRAAGARRAPHSEQNFAPAAFCEPHDGHFTAEAYAAAALYGCPATSRAVVAEARIQGRAARDTVVVSEARA